MRKQLFADLDQAIDQAAGEGLASAAQARARELADAWTQGREALKQQREAKQLAARAFGEARRQGADLAPLKANMQAVSSQLAELEARQQALEADLLALLAPEPAAAATPPVPDASGSEHPLLPQRFRHAVPAGQPDPGLRVDRLQPDAAAAWDAYVRAHPAASPYHFSAWRGVIARSFRQQDLSLVACRANGGVAGVLPLTRLRSRLFGDFAVSLPYFNYGGPLADDQAVEQALLQAAAQQAESLGLAHVEYRELCPREGWPARTDKVSMLRRLPDSVAALDAEVGSKLRAQVRRAEREGPHSRRGRDDALLADFYRVFARNMRDLGTPVYARGFFREVLDAWPESELLVVYLGRRPVGAAFLLGHAEVLEIPWASTLRESNPLGINMLMYWQVLSGAVERGYAWFDFGRSSQDAGTYRFKRQWGAEPVPHSWHYWLPRGQPLPALNPNNPKYRLMIRTWQRLPVALTRLLGPAIVRNLP